MKAFEKYWQVSVELSATAVLAEINSSAFRPPCYVHITEMYCMNIEQDENNTANVSEARRQPCQSTQQTVGGA
jgi:hypothetical protein